MKAYVSVSVDPLHGSQQKANVFWAKVPQKYHLLATKEPGEIEWLSCTFIPYIECPKCL